jgi:hypothetical protein
MPDYRNSKIYKITCDTSGLVYFGSTTKERICDRICGHRYEYKMYLADNTKAYTTSFKVLENNNYRYELIEAFPCNLKEELHAREGWYIKNNECVNKQTPSRTRAEYYQDNKEALTNSRLKYKDENPEAIRLRNKKYYENNKEKIVQKKEEYNILNKEAISLKCKEYQEKNKEAINKKRAEYRKANREEINRKQNEARKLKQLSKRPNI